jgi:hypothetical protein
MKIIEAKRIEDGEGHHVGDIREGCFFPQAIKMSIEDMWAVTKLMKKETLEPQPRDRE